MPQSLDRLEEPAHRLVLRAILGPRLTGSSVLDIRQSDRRQPTPARWSQEVGFTLVELMIAIAILAIVVGIAIPAYNGYIRESRLGAMRMNLDTLRIAVEGFRLDSAASNYGSGVVAGSAIDTRYGWRPEGDNNAYVYTVSASSANPPTYWLRATGNGLFVRCDKTASDFQCCDGTGAGTSACP